VQALTEALKAVPTPVLLASLPESDKEAGSQRGVKALAALSHYFGRVQALWKPVASEEAFEIVRRRLFTSINDKLARRGGVPGLRRLLHRQRGRLPAGDPGGRYFERLMHAYPIHPEVFDRLYEDWSTLDNFQRTRGVLKLMAKVIHRLWKDNNNDLLIMPGSLPLYDADTRNEAIYYLPQGWDPVLERDVDGERAETTEIENKDTRFGSVQACRRTARTIFLGSAPSTANQLVRGIELERVIAGRRAARPADRPVQGRAAPPERPPALPQQRQQPLLVRHAAQPAPRDGRAQAALPGQGRCDPAIRDACSAPGPRQVFGGIHVFTASGDMPDDWALRWWCCRRTRLQPQRAEPIAIDPRHEILKNRGEQPRFKQNRLIFLAADYDSVSRLKDQVRSVLAWQSIVADSRTTASTSTSTRPSRQAEPGRRQRNRAPHGEARPTSGCWRRPRKRERGKGLSELQWEHFQINPGAQNLTQEIERVLRRTSC
jgi:hypothetical protein